MKVPPKKLPVHLGSYPDSGVGRPPCWSSGDTSPLRVGQRTGGP